MFNLRTLARCAVITSISTIGFIGIMSSCSSENDEPISNPDSESQQSESTTSSDTRIHFILSVGGNESRTEITTEDGTSMENYIDLDNIHIYLYDTTTQFGFPGTPIGEITEYTAENLGNGQYYIDGELPSSITKGTTFRVVIAANWPISPQFKSNIGFLIIMSGDDYEYNYGTDSSGNETYYEPSEDNPIPMYGIKYIENYTPENAVDTSNGKLYDLGIIHMVRAMAKVIVEDETDGKIITNVKMTQCWNRGFCAPILMYEDIEELTSTNVNIPGDGNGNYAKTTSVDGIAYTNTFGVITDLPLKKDGTKFMAYVPEFRNVTTGTYSPTKGTTQLKVTAHGNDYTFDFKDYENGEPVGDIFDIIRNHTYVYKVKIVDNMAYIVRSLVYYEAGDITFN